MIISLSGRDKTPRHAKNQVSDKTEKSPDRYVRRSGLIAAAEQSFVDATSAAFLTAAGVLIVTAVCVALRAPRRGARGHHVTEADDPRDAQPLARAARPGDLT